MSGPIDWLRALKNRLFPLPEFVRYDGMILPPRHRRFCGEEFQDHAYFLESAEKEARRLVDDCGCGPESRVMDVGCGQGRLALGLLRVLGDSLHYTGIDVDKVSIDWCRKHLQSAHPSYEFHHLDVANERYNRAGQPLSESFRFNWPDGHFDVIFLYSVFSHMEEADIHRYLGDFRRLLSPSGTLFFTTFVEDNVPPFEVNPAGYAFSANSGPLHVVRFERQHLFQTLEQYGFTVKRFDHRKEANGQSGLYVGKASGE